MLKVNVSKFIYLFIKCTSVIAICSKLKVNIFNQVGHIGSFKSLVIEIQENLGPLERDLSDEQKQKMV